MKVADIQEKVKTITQVKKIGRRYKTQYEELKAKHDKVIVNSVGSEVQPVQIDFLKMNPTI